MEIVLYLFALVLGLVIGSFLNVVILRHGTGWGLDGRSKCLSCGNKLTWVELIPVVSYLVQGGQCKKCHSKISIQYPIVELLTALLFVGVTITEISEASLYSFGGFIHLILVWSIVSLLVAIFVYDFKHKIIPDEFVFTFIILSGISLVGIIFDSGMTEFMIRVLHGVYSGGLLFMLFWLLWFLSKGKLLGFGDAKLVFGFGLWLGLPGASFAVASAFIIGAAVGLVLIGVSQNRLLSRRFPMFTLKSEIPFAPFLILGAFISYFNIF